MAKITVSPGDVIVLGNKEFTVKDGTISDGYHTVDELYEHRIRLFMAACSMCSGLNKLIAKKAPTIKQIDIIRSKLHHDGSGFVGYFILMLNGDQPGNQISYHLPDKYWEACSFAKEVPTAPEWDGHTSDDVLQRLFTFAGIEYGEAK